MNHLSFCKSQGKKFCDFRPVRPRLASRPFHGLPEQGILARKDVSVKIKGKCDGGLRPGRRRFPDMGKQDGNRLENSGKPGNAQHAKGYAKQETPEKPPANGPKSTGKRLARDKPRTFPTAEIWAQGQITRKRHEPPAPEGSRRSRKNRSPAKAQRKQPGKLAAKAARSGLKNLCRRQVRTADKAGENRRQARSQNRRD